RPSTTKPAPAAVTWLRKQAIPIATAEAGNGFDDLQRLKKVVGNARIVALGEGTHGTHEFFQMKHRLVEFLASEMGFTLFAIEANLPEAARVNDYILNGRGDPREALKGLYFWTWNTQEVLDMIEWMRAFNQSGRGRGPQRLRAPDGPARFLPLPLSPDGRGLGDPERPRRASGCRGGHRHHLPGREHGGPRRMAPRPGSAGLEDRPLGPQRARGEAPGLDGELPVAALRRGGGRLRLRLRSGGVQRPRRRRRAARPQPGHRAVAGQRRVLPGLPRDA